MENNLPQILNTSHLVPSQVPLFIQTEYPQFIKFFTEYYTWLENNSKLKHIPANQDIDDVDGEYLAHHFLECLALFPEKSVVDRRFITKHIKSFYKSRGAIDSFKFLLRAVYAAKNIDIYYPKDDLLRTSDGKWYVQEFLRIQLIVGDVGSLTNNIIYGEDSRAKGAVVATISSNGITQVTFEEHSRKGHFNEYEKVYAYSNSTLSEPDIIGYVQPVVVGIDVDDPGDDYRVGDYIKFTGLYSCYGHVSEIYPSENDYGKGGIKSIKFDDFGWGIPNKSSVIYSDNTKSNPATITPVFGTNHSYPGLFLTVDGCTSEPTKHVQDGHYWQLFSYDLISDLQKDNCSSTIDKLLHPLGTKRFHTVRLISDVDFNIPTICDHGNLKFINRFSSEPIGGEIVAGQGLRKILIVPEVVGRPLGPTYETFDQTCMTSFPNSKENMESLMISSSNESYWTNRIANTQIGYFTDIRYTDFVGDAKYRELKIVPDSWKHSRNSGLSQIVSLQKVNMILFEPRVVISSELTSSIFSLTSEAFFGSVKYGTTQKPSIYNLVSDILNSDVVIGEVDYSALRRSVPGPIVSTAPIPDGDMTVEDRKQLSNIYRGPKHIVEESELRRSISGPIVLTAPIPDGLLSAEDRKQLSNIYRGPAGLTPGSSPPVVDNPQNIRRSVTGYQVVTDPLSDALMTANDRRQAANIFRKIRS